MLKKIAFITSFSILLASILSFATVFAAEMADMGGEVGEHSANFTSMGPMIAGRMLHGWSSLVAALVLFFLGFKTMKGGRMAKPIILIGIGALIDASIGLFPPGEEHIKYMWLGSLVFSSSVVLAVIWLNYILGVFKKG